MTDAHQDHSHAEVHHIAGAGYYEIMETAVRELLIDKKLIAADEIRRQIEVLDSRTPALGAKVVPAPGWNPTSDRGWWPMAVRHVRKWGLAFIEVRVHDSTAMVRYLVLPRRPDGAENYTQEQLAALVTRDTMIGVVPVRIDGLSP